MSFVRPQRNPVRYGVGVGVAVAFHVALVWALLNGLGRQVMQLVKAPIEAKIIEEVKPPPPPPKVIELPPPPKFVPPPPAFVPPPEVRVQAPPPQPTITAAVAEPPAEPPPVARAEPAPAPVPAPAPPAPVSAAVVCPNYSKVMGDAGFPREAQRAGLEEGSALVQFTLGPGGEIRGIKALEASHPSFAKGAMRIVGEYRCAGQGREINVKVPFVFRSS